MGGRRGMWPLAACLAGILCLGSELAAAGETAEVVSVTPHLQDGLLVCDVHTAGLPGEKINSSVRSGLVSSIDLMLELIQAEDGHRLAAGQASFQLAFDLWEEIFSVRGDGSERRFRSLDELQAHLAELGTVPVIPVNRLTPDARYRLRIGLQVYPIAPVEQDRVEDVIAGDQRPRREGQDQQEASVSLGQLIRFFYKGGGEGRGNQVILSDWFTRKELRDEAH